MDIKSYLLEYNLELDDIRWYLCGLEAFRLLEYRDRRVDLQRLIWSGELEADLYNIEERFVEDLQAKLDARQADEAEVRKIMGEISTAKMLR